MKVVDAQVDWRDDVTNDPRLEMLVDEMPSRDELRFEHDDGLWIAEHDEYVEDSKKGHAYDIQSGESLQNQIGYLEEFISGSAPRKGSESISKADFDGTWYL